MEQLNDKRFSLKDFFADDPETIQWIKSINTLPNTIMQQESNDDPAKSVVRGMTNSIDLIQLSEEVELKNT